MKPVFPLGENNQINFGSTPRNFCAVMQTLKDKLPEGVTPLLAIPSKGDDPYRIWWATFISKWAVLPCCLTDGTTVTMDEKFKKTPWTL